MKAYQIVRPGLDGLEMVDLPSPKPGAGQVRVRIHAASLNYRDLMVVSGTYGRSPLKVPLIPLSDGAGEVLEVGSGVSDLKPGDRVIGNFFPNWIDGPPEPAKQEAALGGSVDGMLAEEVILEAAAAVPIPKALSFEEAATLPCAGLTAWIGLVELGALKKGQTVLALGTGGVSVFGLQIAKAYGCRVIVTSSSDEKLGRAKSLGADFLVNYRTHTDWDRLAREHTAGAGVDHVLEVAGGATLEKSLASLKVGGHIVLIGMLSGSRADAEKARANGKGIRVDSVYVGSVSYLRSFCAFVQDKGIKPVIDHAYAFGEARKAYEALKAAGHFGKIVIRV
jgi:NADPH:quinone reductase-like Zn-dependent oxidoreductase